MFRGVKLYLGTASTKAGAAVLYDAAVRELFDEPSTNFRNGQLNKFRKGLHKG